MADRGTVPGQEPGAERLDIALFRDATEILFALADTRHAADPDAPLPPRRAFVKDADEAHRIALEGPQPVVGMSLDDLLHCRASGHPRAGDLCILAGVHRGFLQLMARPGLAGIADLRGRRLAVDTETGYARALDEILARNGIDRARDVEIVHAGATDLRYRQLLDGGFDATLLGAPFTRLAAARGFVPLCSVIGALGGYQAIVLVARRPWLAAHAEAAEAVRHCLQDTLRWARQPRNRPTLEAALPGLLPPAATEIPPLVAEDLFGPDSEFLPDGRLDPGDAAVVLALFNRACHTALPLEDVLRLAG